MRNRLHFRKVFLFHKTKFYFLSKSTHNQPKKGIFKPINTVSLYIPMPGVLKKEFKNQSIVPEIIALYCANDYTPSP